MFHVTGGGENSMSNNHVLAWDPVSGIFIDFPHSGIRQQQNYTGGFDKNLIRKEKNLLRIKACYNLSFGQTFGPCGCQLLRDEGSLVRGLTSQVDLGLFSETWAQAGQLAASRF